MSRIFLGNFDFEHELATLPTPAIRAQSLGGTSKSKSGRAGRFAAERACAWLAWAQPGDVILADRRFTAADFPDLAQAGWPIPQFCSDVDELPAGPDWELVPWGWTDSLVTWSRSRGWSGPVPPAEIVRHVNSREFRFGLERAWNIGLPAAGLARTLPELEELIAAAGDLPLGWILKANFGMAGREALRGRGPQLEAHCRNWAERRLRTTGPIVFEPLVERVAEAGVQVDVPMSAPPVCLGITPQLVDRSGVYRGSRFACSTVELADWQPAVDVALRTARELQSLGYFGPLGIDAMWYRTAAGELRLRPLQDLNARLTMGRLSLGWQRLLANGVAFDARAVGGQGVSPRPLENVCHPLRTVGSWIHLSPRQVAHLGIATQLRQAPGAGGPRWLLTSQQSPANHSGQSVVVLAATSADRDQAEAQLLGLATEVY
ncbi:MAG: hypothetical protein JSS02_24445 [Planctomycetes bacterium]|nr:hypothetical protein [Planctomycetota bacterium]